MCAKDMTDSMSMSANHSHVRGAMEVTLSLNQSTHHGITPLRTIELVH